jgi:hypothetical protein
MLKSYSQRLTHGLIDHSPNPSSETLIHNEVISSSSKNSVDFKSDSHLNDSQAQISQSARTETDKRLIAMTVLAEAGLLTEWDVIEAFPDFRSLQEAHSNCSTTSFQPLSSCPCMNIPSDTLRGVVVTGPREHTCKCLYWLKFESLVAQNSTTENDEFGATLRQLVPYL